MLTNKLRVKICIWGFKMICHNFNEICRCISNTKLPEGLNESVNDWHVIQRDGPVNPFRCVWGLIRLTSQKWWKDQYNFFSCFFSSALNSTRDPLAQAPSTATPITWIRITVSWPQLHTIRTLTFIHNLQSICVVLTVNAKPLTMLQYIVYLAYELIYYGITILVFA